MVNSSLYKPDRYYNKYCIREKKGSNYLKNNNKSSAFKKKRTFLDINDINKKGVPKQSSKFLLEDTLNKKKTVNPRATASSKLVTFKFSKLTEINKDSSSNSDDSNDLGKSDNKKNENNNNNNSAVISESEEDIANSLDSSFNEETLKKCISDKFTNKFIIPPCFLKMQNKDLGLEDIEEIILNYYGEDKLIKKNEYENKYIFDKLPIIDYEGVKKIEDKFAKEKKLEELDLINRYLIPTNIVRDSFQKPKRTRSYTLAKSMTKDNRLDPKIIQLEDFMKEILSSSGKNASNILYPKGIKEIKKEDSLKKEEKSEEKENSTIKEEEKENGGSKDMNIEGKINIAKYNNLDYLSMIDFQNIVIRRHFASIIFQKKVNAYQSNIISTNTYNILSKMIFNVFLYSGNKSIDDFQVCRALTKSLYLYYKKNNKGKKVYLFQAFNKAKPFDIWNDKAFWLYFYEREIDNQTEKNDNTKFNVLIEIASIMNDLHFSANTQVGIIVDLIAKKEISDKDLQTTLFKAIVKQFNNRVVVSASMD